MLTYSHGVKRSRLTPQGAEAKRQKESGKIKSYLELERQILEMKRSKIYTNEALGKTSQLLDQNPEYYTIWNYRRDILQALFPALTPKDVVSQLSNDLRLTTSYLLVHPKVYWIWNHRRWCLESVPNGPDNTQEWRKIFWDGELKLVEKMLDADARNFHAWAYRSYVLSSLPVQRPLNEELDYTQSKIESNFSNFSAWHYRAKTLAKIWDKNQTSEEEIRKTKDAEFELVTQALWTDPGDQSGWLYHQWLVGQQPPLDILERELKNIRDLLDAEPDSKWCINALAHCSLLLARQSSAEADEADGLRLEAKKLYEMLSSVDPDRKERYKDMGKIYHRIRKLADS
nr:geranylgeranyl transferase type-2 subunit alpha [Cryptococcus depauperatus CBS 7855]